MFNVEHINIPRPGFAYRNQSPGFVCLSVCVIIISMEVAAAAAAAIITAWFAMGGTAVTNNLLVFRLPSFTLLRHPFTRPLLKARPSRHEDDEISTRLIKPDHKLERPSADSHSCNRTADCTYDNTKYLPLPPPAWHFHINDDLQGRMKAYRAKCDCQVLDEGVSTDQAFYREFAEYVSSVWLHKDLARKYYEKALTQIEMDGSCSSNAGELMAEYAQFQWKALGNDEEANRIFENAVRTYPEDVLLLGCYASFLWESSDSD